MNKQIKTPLGIKIVAGLMFIGGLVIFLVTGVIPIIAIITNVQLQMESMMNEMKSPTVVDILKETLAHGYMWPLNYIIYAIISLSFIIAAIGLWKMKKKWGLFISYFALSVSIFITTIEAIKILILKKVPGVIGVDYLSEVTFVHVPLIIVAISILYYLCRKRRCFS